MISDLRVGGAINIMLLCALLEEHVQVGFSAAQPLSFCLVRELKPRINNLHVLSHPFTPDVKR